MLIKNCDKTIFAFSDTHGSHHRLQVPENTDILICAGDAVEVLEPEGLRETLKEITEKTRNNYGRL